MADNKATIVIKKVKKGGHGGAHGGAWKVAYADFVTAMMCFFLVMWLMGADEVTKASIANYFNNPTSPEAWRPDLHDRDAIPLGNQTGAGESVLKGADGQVPEDLVQRPSPVIERKPDSEGPTDSDGSLSKEELSAVETLTLSFNEEQIFMGDQPEMAMPKAKEIMKKVRKVSLNFGGSLVIRATYDESQKNGYESQMGRLVSIKNHMVENRWTAEDQINVSLRKSNDPNRVRKVEFTFMK
jgi:hypothetical protein